jgi:hypothetical protein
MITASCAVSKVSEISHNRHSKRLDKVRNEPFGEMQDPLARQEGMPCTKPKGTMASG